MGLRKACAYSRKYARPYTRKSRVTSKSYIKTIPPQKIVKLFMGNIKDYEQGKFPFIMRLVSKEKVMIRDNALEAARQIIHHDLEEHMPGAYYFALKKYPHHILRENRMFSGGSKGERVNQGMQQSFGTAIGRAAFVEPNEDLFIVAFTEKKFLPFARNAIEKIKPKLPCATKIVLSSKSK